MALIIQMLCYGIVTCNAGLTLYTGLNWASGAPGISRWADAHLWASRVHNKLQRLSEKNQRRRGGRRGRRREKWPSSRDRLRSEFTSTLARSSIIAHSLAIHDFPVYCLKIPICPPFTFSSHQTYIYLIYFRKLLVVLPCHHVEIFHCLVAVTGIKPVPKAML